MAADNADPVFAALTRAHPELTRESFDDMAIDTFELIAAVRTIALQAGLLITESPPPPLRACPLKSNRNKG